MAKEFITLTLNEQSYTFRALDLDQVEALEGDFAIVTQASASSQLTPKEALQATARIAAASLQAKHPGISIEQVRKLLTIATIETVLFAVRGVSQIQPATEAGEAPAGNG